jgi:alkanesulfonate monooxygenase SsuD/methylene tetrahydromethanopterin reductase-like flavin-dependent oxidoreductase (luciferase family)
MDESLQILRGLSDGTPVTFDGEFFSLHEALILPAPSPRVPLIVGGRSDAAVRRAAKFGDGWLGIWVSPRRYRGVRDQIAREAIDAGRDANAFEHALNVWCGFASTREAHASRSPHRCRTSTRCPSSRSSATRPMARPSRSQSSEPYIESGCSRFNVIPCADDADSAIVAVGELRKLLA